MRSLAIVALILGLLGSSAGCKAVDNEYNYLNGTLWEPKSK